MHYNRREWLTPLSSFIIIMNQYTYIMASLIFIIIMLVTMLGAFFTGASVETEKLSHILMYISGVSFLGIWISAMIEERRQDKKRGY